MTSREKSLLNSAVQATRPEVDCQICFEIFVRPVTIPCGHTFCTACLEQLPIPIQRCPICRRGLLSATFGPTNRTLEGILNIFWEDCLLDRKALAQAARESIDVTSEPMPIIPYYASAAPGMSLTLLLYDTKYRFTIKRLMEGNRVFGMVLPVLMTGTMSTNDQEFIHTGTLMHIEVLQQLAGGGCRIQAVALDRFAVRSYEWERGIAMAMVRKLDEFGN